MPARRMGSSPLWSQANGDSDTVPKRTVGECGGRDEAQKRTRIAHRGTRPTIDIHPNVFAVREDGSCKAVETCPRHSSTAPTVGRRFGRDDQHCFKIFHRSSVNHRSFGLSGRSPPVTFCMTTMSLWPAKGYSPVSTSSITIPSA